MADKPKLETVAREAGVSVATASQALRGTGRISQETRKRVLAAADRLNYVTDQRAASMRSGVNREIGFAIQRISNPFNAEVISGVSDRLDADGYLVAVLDSRDDCERERRHLEAFIRSSRAGLLWVPAAATPPSTLQLLAAHRIPTVTFLRRIEGAAFDHVGIEDAEATAAATRHLQDLGHRRIAYLGGDAAHGVRVDRIAGYRRAMEARGDAPPLVWESPDSKRGGLDAVGALLGAHPDVTGLICNGDMVALGAILGVQRLGLKPGKDVSVVGFDDIEDARLATPPLTTMAVRPYDLGRRLAGALLHRIANPDSPKASLLSRAELVARESAGQPSAPRIAFTAPVEPRSPPRGRR